MARDEVKQMIIDKTRVLIQEKGAVTIKDIAEATNMNVAAVNYHFGSKDNLIQLVIFEVLNKLKQEIMERLITLNETQDMDSFLFETLTLLYNFVVNNVGVTKYLFLSLDSQLLSANELINSFFAENEFTELVYKQLNLIMKTDDPKKLTTRYMIIFSSVVMPLLVQLLQGQEGVATMFTDPEFKEYYINDLLDLIKKQ
ncbi:MAG: helix-turn-helix domain-containing protein [Bacilli bacterium]|jgi:AcrR family transcriptional regulator|nr:helix-turn-helix domain-containing protein [Bacilli bacterium]NLN80521.1 helix-turn-helix transcriptional regulator [Erysipelotrichia bacterium]